MMSPQNMGGLGFGVWGLVCFLGVATVYANPPGLEKLRTGRPDASAPSTQPSVKSKTTENTPVYASIQWSPLRFEQAIQKAQEQRRWIFIDMYATWCYPCKRYDHEVFSRAKVATYMHQHFIPIRRDGYRGEGNLLRRRYNCVTFPCLLVVNQQGEEVERITKFYGARDFLMRIQQIQQGKDTLASIEQRWKQQPSNHVLRFVLGSRLAYRGDARCVEHLRAVSLQPPPGFPHLAGQSLYVLARIYYRNTRRDWPSTVKVLQEFLQRFPNHSKASQGRRLLQDALRRMR